MKIKIYFYLTILLLASAFTYELTTTLKFFAPFRTNGKLTFHYYLKRITGFYGDHRSSDIYGHKHAGVDIKGDYGEIVYAIGAGEVINIFRDFPNKTVYIRHFGKYKNIISAYIHIEDIRIEVGDRVTEKTIIGRILNKEELDESQFGTPPHLHLEMRHNSKDKGNATFNCMTVNELDRYCINPIKFFKHLEEE